MRKTFKTLFAISIGAVVAGASAQLQVPGSGNGYGQPCAGQNTYGAGPCYPTAYIPTFSGAINTSATTANNMFMRDVQPDYFGSTSNYANSPMPTVAANGTVTGGLHKFINDLPQIDKPNDLGMQLVVATPDQSTYLGAATPAVAQDGVEYASDYYEIGVVQYSQQMHGELPPTSNLRGYVQIETPAVVAALQAQGKTSAHYALKYPNGNPIKNLAGQQVYSVAPPNYLGPSIIAEKNRPVRVKFTNYLPTGAAGDLPLPVDSTYMGAGKEYTQNRVTVHLHGGATPWISDGTPHQWTAPVGEVTANKRGPSVKFVPDMWFDGQGNSIDACAAQLVCSVPGATNDPGEGSLTMYYTNQQSAKFMWYHDHAYGITRLNVYDGMAAGYVLKDAVENDLINGTNLSGGNPGGAQLPDGIGIPLIIQDKTWVDPNNIGSQDPTWSWGSKPGTATTAGIPTGGDLWLPHVYMTNQHPTAPSGVNDIGRWDYNSWIYPPITTQIIGPMTNLSYVDPITTPNEPALVPGMTNPVGTPESFMDSAVVNGTAWPKLSVTPNYHRFKMLNASDDRTYSFNWYVADKMGITLMDGGSLYALNQAPSVTFTGGWKAGPNAGTPAVAQAIVSGVVDGIAVSTNVNPNFTSPPTVSLIGGGGSGATAIAVLDPANPGNIIVQVTNGGRGYTSAPTVRFNGVAATPPIAVATISNIVVDVKITSPAVPAYDTAPTITIAPPTDPLGRQALAFASPNTEVAMVPAMLNPAYPATWPADGRNGGTNDPTTVGPQFTILANEGGWLPKPQTLPTQPVTYEQSRRVIFTLVVKDHGLVVGPAERIDTLVDFSNYKGQTVILYNDAPAPYPFFDERYDYYTGSPDNTFQGGAPSTLPGYGPNTRTIMQVNVCDPGITDQNSLYYCDPIKTAGMNNGTPATPFDMGKLNASWSAIYARAQEAPLVPTSSYNEVYKTTLPDQSPNLTDPNFTFQPMDPTTLKLSGTKVTLPIQDKAIIENWDMEYGRMNALIGGALPNMGPQAGVAQPYSYFNPPTEVVDPTFVNLNTGKYPMVGTTGDGTQIWRLDHQGIDQHYMHFHLVNVQLIGRVAIDGTVFPIDPEEQGLKETIRLTPTLDTFIAVRPVQPFLPWVVPNSVRPLDPASPVGAQMTDSAGTILTNVMTDYGMEYVLHCHLLGHEEHDMMRPFVMVMPLNLTAPVLPAATKGVAFASTTYTATGGLTNTVGLNPYTFSISAGALPAGLKLSAGGVLSGTPTVSGTFNFTVMVKDSSSPVKSVSVPQTLTVGTVATNAPAVTYAALPNGTIGTPYSQTIAATGGTGPYTFVATGTLPPGLSLSSAGVLSGTPGSVGNYSFSVTATDSKNVASAAQAFTMSTVSNITLNAVTNLAASISTNSRTTATGETLTWTNTSTGQSGYKVELSTAPGIWTTVTTTPVQIGNQFSAIIPNTLTNGVTYSYRVSPMDGTTVGAASNIATIDLNVKPIAPGAITAVSGTIGKPYTVDLTWTDLANNNTTFSVQKCNANTAAKEAACRTGSGWVGTSIAAPLGPNSTSVTATGLSNGVKYMFRVFSRNGIGTSAGTMTTAPVVAQ